MAATLQAPPNGTGTTIDGTTPASGNFRQTINSGDPSIVGNSTYRATYTAQSAGTSATTNIATFGGSATKTIRVTKLMISGTIATTAENYDCQLVRQSAADTGGSQVTAATIVKNDTNNGATAATAPTFNTAATTAGAAVGTLHAQKIFFPVKPAEAVTYNLVDEGKPGKQGIVLRGVADVLAVTLNGATPGHASAINMTWEWTEE